MANIGKGLTSGLGGAASGAAIGTALMPGIGTAAGAIGGGLLGFLGGGGLSNDDAPKGPAQAPLVNPVTGEQLNTAYGQTQQGLAQQQALIQALQAQNGAANQSSVFNQLQGVANGQGPNPAQAQLANATGANVANQAALMASQRGAGANAGLIARQAAQQGAGTQQQAIGQAAALQANQSLGALNQLGGIAGQQVAQQQGAIQGYNAAAQGQQNALLGSVGQYNNALAGNASTANAYNAPLAQQNNAFGQNVTGGLLSGAGTLATAFAGKQKNPDTGGTVATGNTQPVPGAAGYQGPQMGQKPSPQGPNTSFAQGGAVGPRSKVGMHFKSGGMHASPQQATANDSLQLAKGGKVPAKVSPGEKYLSPKAVEKVQKTGVNPMKVGETIPGKPKVKGAKDSYANDTVSKTLQAGGIVLPRHVTQAKDPAKEAAKFVAQVLAKSGKGLRK